ncbi:nostrin-like isoform X1 [Homarus americanus]|uniref:nostrin-like isoform X1 n=1 Tax=Homarus americanus TaxID=6706 RepID=UPI001C46E6C0|nr:nostrin-like isoform X1 [Homarus americanus]
MWGGVPGDSDMSTSPPLMPSLLGMSPPRSPSFLSSSPTNSSFMQGTPPASILGTSPASKASYLSTVRYFRMAIEGHNGFDELRRYIKSGGEFCKELAVIMHERAELEANYAKGLHKLSGKLLKASKESMGTVNQAWQMVGAELEQEGDMHKSIASAIADDVVRPLRQLIETQHKIRKGVESMVDKTTKNLHDWRAAESKAKKQCYSNCRDNEKIQDMMLEARLGRGKTLSDKETLKMEKQRRKAEEAVQKSDLEYYTCCIRAERARLEWESAVYKGSNCFQTLEEERLQALKDLVVKYHKNAKEAAPKMVATAGRLDEPVSACDVEKDIQTVISAKGTGENVPEQMLPDFYAEDMNNIMNRERRREALEKFIQMLKTDLERERRGKQGVENLAKALQETPTFGGEESQQDVNDKLQHDAYNRLQHMKAMLAYLEAARYKVQSSLDELSNKPKMTHPLAKHIEVHRDKQGLTFSILKVPPWVRGNSVDVSPASDSPTGSPNWNDRGTADGTSVQPDSDFDEFSSQGSDRDYQTAMTEDNVDSGTKDGVYYARPLSSAPTVGRCKALYDYEANMYDELTVRTGDIINIHEKQPDGWWVGELEGVIGIFPATYVEEID